MSDTPGLVQRGNIDLNNRPVVKNPDGSISTVRSITIGGDGEPVFLIPTVVAGQVVPNEQAIQHFRQTGEHLGQFDTIPSADAYAQSLHEAQAQQYLSPQTMQGYVQNQIAGTPQPPEPPGPPTMLDYVQSKLRGGTQ